MPITEKDILSYLGITDSIDSIDDFKSKFGSSFIRKDLEAVRGDADFYGKLLSAKANGTITALKRAAKKNGVKIDETLLEGKLEDVIETVFDTVAVGFNGEIKKLKDESSTGKEQRFLELEKQYQKELSEKERLAAEKESLTNEYTTFKTQTAQEIKSTKINSSLKELWGGFKWDTKAQTDELRREGFQSKIGKKFKFDHDDSGNLIVTDLQGNKVKNHKKVDTYKTPEEVLVDEGIEAGVYAINPHEKKQEPKVEPKKIETPVNGAATTVVDPRRQVNTMRPQATA